MSDNKQINPYLPGREDVFKFLMRKYHFKTLKQNDTDRQAVFVYVEPDFTTEIKDGKAIQGDLKNPEVAGIYTRDESYVQALIDREYHHLLREMLQTIEEKLIQNPEDGNLKKLRYEVNEKHNRDGVTNADRAEIMSKIRVNSFVDRITMNPDRYIPLLHGLLNWKTWQIEPFSPTHFYTWKILGDYDPAINSLNQIPRFKDLLIQAFPARYAVTILDYLAYCYFPSFPMQLVLVMAGIHRRGKGTIVRVIEQSMKEGFRRIELEKLLNPDNRFALQGVEGKKVLFDPEFTRDPKRKMSFTRFNSLFGGDKLDYEEKFKASHDLIGKFAGILIGNTPFFHVDDTAFLSRLLIVVSHPDPIKKDIVDLDKQIWQAEGMNIVPYLLNRLRVLIQRDFRFANQKSYDEYAELWDLLADSVRTFMDLLFTYEEGSYVDRDEVLKIYKEWCRTYSLIPVGEKRFSYLFGREYPLKNRWDESTKARFKAFENCAPIINPPRRQDNQSKSPENKEPTNDDIKSDLGL